MLTTRWVLALFLFGLLGADAAAAQPPALQPRVETRLEWAEPPPLRQIRVGEDGAAQLTLRAAGKIFVSGGYIACQPGTAYKYDVGFVEEPPPWGLATLTPDDRKAITFTVPEGVHAGGWPGPAYNQWSWKDGPTLSAKWNMDTAKVNATIEYKISGVGPAKLVSGGCLPDPLAQPTRHIRETLNVTRPYVAPVPAAVAGCAAAVTCAPVPSTATDAQTPAADLLLVALAVACVALVRARRAPRT